MGRMTIYALEKPLSDGVRVHPFHRAMYHGVPARNGEREPLMDRGPKLGEHDWPHMDLEKNIYDLSGWFSPALYPVVSGDVRDRLQGLPNIEFLQTKVIKAFRFPYSVGDDSYEKVPGLKPDMTHQQFNDLFPNDPTAYDELPELYELVAADLVDIQRDSPDERVLLKTREELDFTEQMLALPRVIADQYPIVFADYVVLVNGEVLDAIAGAIDWDYYRIGGSVQM